MATTERIKQGGSAIAYIVVGVLLVIGLVGSIYIVRQRGEAARREQAVTAYEEQQKAGQKTETSTSETESENVQTGAEVANGGSETDASSSDLPQTGPENIVFNAVILFIVTSAAVGYLSSLRRRVSPL